MGMVRSRHYTITYTGDRTHQYSHALSDMLMAAEVPRVLTDGCPTQATTTFMASRLSPSTPRPRRVYSAGSIVTFRPTRALSTSLAAEPPRPREHPKLHISAICHIGNRRVSDTSLTPPRPREHVITTLPMSGGNQRDARITVSKFSPVNTKDAASILIHLTHPTALTACQKQNGENCLHFSINLQIVHEKIF